MTAQEAEDFLRSYRSMLKTWTMAVAGFSNVDSDLLYRQLEADQDVLADIAISYPEKSYSVDLLINSRSRTWAGYAEQRLPRPKSRQS